MKIVVTGSHGFIGSHLVKELISSGHTVDQWDRKVERHIDHFEYLLV